jgi:hypothetical protein
MDPATILSLVGQAYALYQTVRANAQAAGISDAELAAVTADYDARIARREVDATPTEG